MSCATTSSCLRLDRNTLSSLRMNHSQRGQSVCRRRSTAPTIMPPCLVEDPAPDRQDFGDDVDLGRRPRSTNKIFSVQVLAGRSWPGRDRGRRSTAETASTPRSCFKQECRRQRTGNSFPRSPMCTRGGVPPLLSLHLVFFHLATQEEYLHTHHSVRDTRVPVRQLNGKLAASHHERRQGS